MLRGSLVAAAFVMFFATPALAFHCPADAKAIDAALTKVSLSSAQKAEVMQLKTDGMKLHSTKKHTEGQLALAKAMRIILTNM